MNWTHLCARIIKTVIKTNFKQFKMLKMENRNGGKWLVFNLTVVCFVFVGVECQIVDQGSVVPPLCDMCECTSSPSDLRGSKSDLRVACSFTPGQELLSLDKIEWPEDYGDERVFARFEGLGLTTIQKLPRNDRLLLLSFNNNAIRTIYPEAFSELKSLEFLHLSNNDLAEVTPDIFKNLARLEQLDLSANKLSDFNPIDFAELTSLKTLNLNKNNLMKVPSHALSKLQHLEELNLSENNLFLLNFGDVKESGFVLENLKYLILASNKITVVSKGTFEQAQKLVYLDLSNNVLESIEDGALSELSSLRELDLSGNRLKAPGALPPSLVMARLQNNLVADWPQLPAGLQLLNLAENQLTTMYHNIQLDSLQILNISKNVLSSFEIGRPFPELELLDISFNLFQEVPEALSSLNFPNLRTFRVDGNPMKKLIFPSEVSLARISASFLREVTSIDASSFAKVSSREGSEMAEEGETACLDVSISNCEGLVTIHEETFQGMKLCHLDLSHNNLSSLRENVADWNSVLHGVNLQNNPWNCDCFLQWMLDILLKKLYTDYPMYLHELKCEFPRAIQGLRLVHWFNHGESAFCSGNVDIDRSSNYIMAKSTNSQDSGIRLILGSGTFKIVILNCIGVGLLLVVALGVYLGRGKYRHNYRVRRQMMKKRQQMTDAKKLNSIRVEQNEALTA